MGEASRQIDEASNPHGSGLSARVAQERLRQSFIRDQGLDHFEEDVTIHPVIELCQRLCNTPVALFTVLGTEHQYFAARSGTALTHTPREYAFCNKAIESDNLRRPYVVVDAANHPDWRVNPLVRGEPHVRFYLGLPVLTPGGTPIGTVCLIDFKPRLATVEMIEALTLTRDIVERELWQRTNSQVDSLTGVLLRREAETVLERELRRARRTRQTLSVLLIDIDFFKAINDEFGHLIGDQALRQTAAAIGACLNRAGDAVGRWGGEEFLCVVPGASRTSAKNVAERIRQTVADTVRFTHGGVERGLTVSIGGACFDTESAQTGLVLVGAADKALYTAKHAGRNRCAFAETAN